MAISWWFRFLHIVQCVNNTHNTLCDVIPLLMVYSFDSGFKNNEQKTCLTYFFDVFIKYLCVISDIKYLKNCV
jgi:hypothetical protein